MKRKPTSSNSQVIIYNVFKYFKAHKPSNSQQSLFRQTAEATGSSLSKVRRIVKQNSPKTRGKKRPNTKEEFNKLDEFNLGIIKQQDFFIEKTTKQTERGNKIPILNNYFKYITEETRFSLRKTIKRINHPRKTRFGFMERNVFEKNQRNQRKWASPRNCLHRP